MPIFAAVWKPMPIFYHNNYISYPFSSGSLSVNSSGKSVANYFELDYWGNSNRSALTFISKNDNRNNIKVYVFSNSPYHFSLLLMDKEDQNRIKFVNKLNEADYLVTNHFYIRNNPIILNNKLKEEYKLLKEFKVDEMIINSVYKIN